MNNRSGEESRNRILQASHSVFSEFGYSGASMRIIAGRAGTSVGGVYLHFRNKEELYLKCMQDWMATLKDRTQDALHQLNDPVDALEAYFAIALDFARSNKEIIGLQGRERNCSIGNELKPALSG